MQTQPGLKITYTVHFIITSAKRITDQTTYDVHLVTTNAKDNMLLILLTGFKNN